MGRFNPQSNLHCRTCFGEGGKVARWYLEYKIKGGHRWRESFPCAKAALDFLNAVKPFCVDFYLTDTPPKGR